MAGGIQQRGGRGRTRPMSEINVTPLVDVMLVLLIVFMVAAPLLTVGIEVELPETEAQALTEQTEPLAVTLTGEGTIFVQESEIAYDDLVPHLQAVSAAGYDQRIYVRADKGVLYDDVARVMGRLNAAGFTSIGLLTE
ncbi:protein TolR [Parvularcula oceani]|uniref:protein TolR n=1 Tax=Parvularcula oceani TaxID=1247963 RepID=UPI0004E0C3EC|nr:protein TolR [Parvularcula oceani]